MIYLLIHILASTYTYICLKIIEIFTKNGTLVVDVTQTFKEKIIAQIFLGQGFGPTDLSYG